MKNKIIRRIATGALALLLYSAFAWILLQIIIGYMTWDYSTGVAP